MYHWVMNCTSGTMGQARKSEESSITFSGSSCTLFLLRGWILLEATSALHDRSNLPFVIVLFVIPKHLAAPLLLLPFSPAIPTFLDDRDRLSYAAYQHRENIQMYRGVQMDQ